jgi:endo-alpha-1,4-polygalactosaminidase (GH114 family)
VYYTLELATYQGTTNHQGAQKILVRLMAFLGSDDIQYLKDHSNQDLYHRLKTKAVCELEDVIRQQQDELGVITAERDHLLEYKGLVEGENEERAKEVEELRRALRDERARRAEIEAEYDALCDQIKEI